MSFEFSREYTTTRRGVRAVYGRPDRGLKPLWSIVTGRILKRGMDIWGALCGLALVPILLLVAIGIKLDTPGPVFFCQRRLGRNGKLITIYKFRTMFYGQGDMLGLEQTQYDDPRVTPFGRLLRRTNIDELPQLWNVLMGEMSLVGPRCHVPNMRVVDALYEDVVPNYHNRHRVLPGITGLAQVRKLRGPTLNYSMAKRRIEADLEYIQNQSVLLDIKILCRTIWQELRQGSGS
ncbi:sugar transferase [Maritalea sp.]|uniref:sugar transferase n=1 Tax=Maritalea sp. TaxID=2003361 RepID=UPI003EF0F01A